MRRIKWTTSDNLVAREAPVVGGPNDGLRVAVAERTGELRYPDAFDMTGYHFDQETYSFRWLAE